MPVRLTETAIRKALKEAAASAEPADGSATGAERARIRAAARRELMDAGCPGLRLRITPAGSANWVLGCRDRQGRARRFPIGSFPVLGISAARSAARDLRAKVHAGADPIADRQRDRKQAVDAKGGVGTLAALLDLYGKKSGARRRSWAHSVIRVQRVFKHFLTRPLATLTPSALQMAAEAYPAAPSASFAVRTLRPALKFAGRIGLADPKLADIRAPEPVKRRKRVLTELELAALLPVLRARTDAYAAACAFAALTGHTALSRLHWRHVDDTARTITYTTKRGGKATAHTLALSDAAFDLLRHLPRGAPIDAVFPGAKAHAAVSRLILLTLTRREEAAAARWREIDLAAGTWTLPCTRTKNEEPHVLPLSRQAIEMLEAVGPASPDGLVFQTFTGKPINNWDRETKAMQKASDTAGWTRHDLRRTAATLLGDMGEDPHIIEAALNHADIRSPLAATYNRSRYRPQVAHALQRLADRLDGIEQGAARIVQLRPAS